MVGFGEYTRSSFFLQAVVAMIGQKVGQAIHPSPGPVPLSGLSVSLSLPGLYRRAWGSLSVHLISSSPSLTPLFVVVVVSSPCGSYLLSRWGGDEIPCPLLEVDMEPAKYAAQYKGLSS